MYINRLKNISTCYRSGMRKGKNEEIAKLGGCVGCFGKPEQRIANSRE